MSGADNTATITIDQRTTGNGIQQTEADMNRLNATMNALRSTQSLMGAESSLSAQNFLQSSSSAQTYNNNLGMLTQQLGYTQAAQSSSNDSLLEGLGLISQIATPILIAAQGIFQFGEQLFQMATSEAWSLLEQGVQTFEQLTEQVAQLNIETQKNTTNWEFLYGGPTHGGKQISEQLALWSSQFSLGIPYTRQDLMSAITTLSAAPKITPAQIEHELSLLSDVAATQGKPGLTLSWAAMAALRASQGGPQGGASTIMLMKDLNLNKGVLESFGYNEKEANTFYPALERYEKSKGEYGASQYITTHTVWGAWTSLIDRFQNFGLTVGGTDLAGNVGKGSLFDNIQNDLNAVSGWISNNTGPGHSGAANRGSAGIYSLDQLSNKISSILGGGATGAGDLFSGLIAGLNKTGAGKTLFTLLDHISALINDPQTRASLDHLGEVVGSVIGPAFKDVQLAVEGFMSALSGSGAGTSVLDSLANAGQWLANPGTQAGIHDFAAALGGIAGGGIKDVLSLLGGILGGYGSTTAAGKDYLDFLKQVSTLLNDPGFQKSLYQLAQTVGVVMVNAWLALYNAAKLAIDTIKDGAAVAGDAMAYIQAVAQYGASSPQAIGAAAALANANAQWGKDVGGDLGNVAQAIAALTAALQLLPTNIAAAIAQAQGAQGPYQAPPNGPTLTNKGHHVPVGVHPQHYAALLGQHGVSPYGLFGGNPNELLFGGFGQTPFSLGADFVDQFSRGAQSRLSEAASPLTQALAERMTQVADEVVTRAMDRLDSRTMSEALAPGGHRVFGAIGALLGG